MPFKLPYLDVSLGDKGRRATKKEWSQRHTPVEGREGIPIGHLLNASSSGFARFSLRQGRLPEKGSCVYGGGKDGKTSS